jgi:hypothetical protein
MAATHAVGCLMAVPRENVGHMRLCQGRFSRTGPFCMWARHAACMHRLMMFASQVGQSREGPIEQFLRFAATGRFSSWSDFRGIMLDKYGRSPQMMGDNIAGRWRLCRHVGQANPTSINGSCGRIAH